jgi:catechol 2,3-dioxygenase-like lactoylglutathione lyase family enzyme
VRIEVCSVFVDDQAKALDFYSRVLGFVKKHDISLGTYRWLTVVSPELPNGVELLLEPNDNPAARAFQQALVSQGIPATLFAVDDIQHEHQRMTELGVTFKSAPKAAGPVTIAVFDDTCGNLIQLVQHDG